MKKLVYGIGVNDSDYQVSTKESGKLVKCAFYARWHNMLQRCYDEKWISRYPTYKNCAVCDEWLTFSNFKRWMEAQDWKGNYLDKDILVSDCRIYSPETCRFVCRITNNFILDSLKIRGQFPIGVSIDKRSGKFNAYCKNPFTKRLEHLGVYSCPADANKAWRERKRQLANEVAIMQSDADIAKAIVARYSE